MGASIWQQIRKERALTSARHFQKEYRKRYCRTNWTIPSQSKATTVFSMSGMTANFLNLRTNSSRVTHAPSPPHPRILSSLGRLRVRNLPGNRIAGVCVPGAGETLKGTTWESIGAKHVSENRLSKGMLLIRNESGGRCGKLYHALRAAEMAMPNHPAGRTVQKCCDCVRLHRLGNSISTD